MEETQRVFKISISAIRAWEKQWREKGDAGTSARSARLQKDRSPKIKA